MKEKTGNNRMALGFAWYRAEDWESLRQAAVDSAYLEERFEDWEHTATLKYEELRARGVRVEKVLIKFPELAQWCRDHNLHLDAAARSRYAAEKVRAIFAASKSD